MDRAVRLRDRNAVPEEHRAAYDAILLAFSKYEAGQDNDARDALQAVGLQSPFLDWKLLLRGLIAYSAKDDARAVENWQRLSKERLPARIAAPLRYAIDPAFRDTLANGESARAQLQSTTLLLGSVGETLKKLQTALAREENLTKAFSLAEKALSWLRPHAPAFVPRLANCFYYAILEDGEPSDLGRYRRLFGSHPDDPDFHRLESIIYSQMGEIKQATKHYTAYAKWLGTIPKSWPKDVAIRAQAHTLHQLANFSENPSSFGSNDLKNIIEEVFGFSSQVLPELQPLDPVPHWKKAMQLAPDWDQPALALFDYYISQKKPTEAGSIAKVFLKTNSASMPMLDRFASLLLREGRASEAVTYYQTLLKLNPLDKSRRASAGKAYVAAARLHWIEGRLAEASAALDEGWEYVEGTTQVSAFALRSLIARKKKSLPEADQWQEQALALPGARLAAALHFVVGATLDKLKPAEKKPYDAMLKDYLAGSIQPAEAVQLYAAWENYHAEHTEYRGQKSQEKKIEEAIVKASNSTATDVEFESMMRFLCARKKWKVLRKILPSFLERFPQNPLFPLMAVEVEFGVCRNGYPEPYQVVYNLVRASSLAKASPEPRHKELLPRIRELQDQVNASAGPFRHTFFRDDEDE